MTEYKSTHRAVVIPLVKLPHPNADNLSIVQNGALTVVIRTEDWKDADRAIYVPAENFVDTNKPEFAWLKKNSEDPGKLEKVRVFKLRGVVSSGICVPCPADTPIGTDFTEALGIIHDDPEAKFEGTEQVPSPKGVNLTKYDIDSSGKFELEELQKFTNWVVTEKIHGTNTRFLFNASEEKFFCGSRTTWVRPDCLHGYAAKKYPQIEQFCRTHPGYVFYGETFGMQGGKYNYGLPPKNYDFRAFDIKRPDGTYLDFTEFKQICEQYGIPMVPIDGYSATFNLEYFKSLAEQPSYVCDKTPREGVVVKTMSETKTSTFERVVFKIIGPNYKG